MTKHPLRGLRRRTSSRQSESTDPATATPDPDRRPRRPHPAGSARPNGRALVGGLLVTAAAVAVFAAYAGAETGPPLRAVAVRTDLPAGHRLTAADLVAEPVDLPAGTAQSGFVAVDDLVGAITLAPLQADELVQRSAVLTDGRNRPAGHEFSFPVDRERALDGDLRPGETVDLLATYGSGADATTSVLARLATVVKVQANGKGTIGGGNLVLTVGLESPDSVLDAAHAAQVAELTVIRATRADEVAATRDRATTPPRPSSAPPSAGGTSKGAGA